MPKIAKIKIEVDNMKEMESLEGLERNPYDFIHRKETTIEKILSFFKTLDGLLLIGKHNFGYCSIVNECDKCQQVCSQMSKKIIPDKVITELIHTGKDITANPWIGRHGMVQLGEHKRDCSKCKESNHIQNSCSDELEIWVAGVPHRIRLD